MRSLVFFIPLLLLLISCADDATEKGEVVTKRIQYDVNIQSPGPDYDWWVQNIEGQAREEFVRQILDAAFNGEVQAWDVFHNKLSPEQVKQIGRRSDTITFQRPGPELELYDTVITETYTLADISRIRFLEEWYMEESMAINKRVIGICPMLERYGPDGSLRGYMPMFWVYFDETYPGVMTASDL